MLAYQTYNPNYHQLCIVIHPYYYAKVSGVAGRETDPLSVLVLIDLFPGENKAVKAYTTKLDLLLFCLDERVYMWPW